ncbi:18850_t:CDS:2, partial [Dentiscutata erythropus]
FVEEHKLTKEMGLEKLSQYAPEILDLLTNDKEKRRQARNRLIKGYNFSKEREFALILLQRVGRYKSQVPLKEGGAEAEEVNICQVSDSTCSRETIKETAQRIMKDKLSEKDIKAISRNLVKTASDPVITRLSNKVQKECSEQRENEGIDFSDHFSLESVKERLDLYNVSNIPDKQALADIMIMLCIRPSEIKSLRISNSSITGYTKNRGSNHFWEVKGSRKAWIYILKAIFASVAHGPKNASKANTYASEAFRHSPDNHASPSKRYTIVNMWRRGEPYNQAKAFELFDEN